jgi:uncharacterized membrane protein (UPF0127 family)
MLIMESLDLLFLTHDLKIVKILELYPWSCIV